MNLRNAVVSWTGGKDGCLSCYKVMQEGWRVNYLLSFRNISRIGSHDINPELILAQSEAIGIPLIHREFTSYEQEFKRTILDLRANGEKIVGTIPVKRLGEPSEIASIISWIASNEGGYSTGADFSVNGGLHMH